MLARKLNSDQKKKQRTSKKVLKVQNLILKASLKVAVMKKKLRSQKERSVNIISRISKRC
jgi:hypothetical protein